MEARIRRMCRGPSGCSRMLCESIPRIVRPESGSLKPSLPSTATVGIPNRPRCWRAPTKQPRGPSPPRQTGLMLRLRRTTGPYVGRARNLNVIGRAAEALAPVEKAIRRSQRDPELYVWYFVLCHANTHLARDTQAIEWCLKSLATGKTFYSPTSISPLRTPGGDRTQRRRQRLWSS